MQVFMIEILWWILVKSVSCWDVDQSMGVSVYERFGLIIDRPKTVTKNSLLKSRLLQFQRCYSP